MKEPDEAVARSGPDQCTSQGASGSVLQATDEGPKGRQVRTVQREELNQAPHRARHAGWPISKLGSAHLHWTWAFGEAILRPGACRRRLVSRVLRQLRGRDWPDRPLMPSKAFLETYFAAYANKQAWAAIIWNTPKPSGEEGKWHSEWHQLCDLYQMTEFAWYEEANVYFTAAPFREKPPPGQRGAMPYVDGSHRGVGCRRCCWAISQKQRPATEKPR